jgi:hypothetical protein
MSKTLTQGLLAVPEPGASKQQFIIKLREILATPILELAPFEQIPHPFLRVEFGSIGRHTFQVDTFGSSLLEKHFDHFAAMDRGTIPDDQQFARDLTRDSA